jgi:hypothetical protein
MDEKRSLQSLQVNTRDEFVARIMNSAALLKHERQDATRAVVKRVEKCIAVDGGILEHLLLLFIEIIYIIHKYTQ